MKKISSAIGEVIEKQTHPELCNCGNRRDVGYECWTCHDARTGKRAARDKLHEDNLAAIGLAKKEGEGRHAYAMRCRQRFLASGHKVGSMAGTERS